MELNFVSYKYDQGTYLKEFGKMHVCTPEEIEKFSKPSGSSRRIFESFINKKAMMCPNQLDDNGNPINLNLYGINGRFGEGLEYQIRPCIPKQLTPENKHLVDKECIADYNSPESMAAKFKES